MALVLNNRVRETTTTTGTGAQTLGGAVDGFQTFAAGIGNDNTTYYTISLNSENEWEVGLGTLNGDSSTLTRTTVLESSNSDAAVDFTAGSKEIFCTLPAEKAMYLDASGAGVGGLAAVVDDTTPQLGGDLDVNGNAIVSASDGAIAINANGTGTVTMTTNSVTGDVIPGKLAGTNFSNSLLVGHSTTGTLSSASNNTAVGLGAMDAVTSGNNNTIMGYNAGTAISSGIRNTYIGTGSGAATTTTHRNTGVGRNAGNLCTGDYNVFLGHDSGDNVTTGDGNVIIGASIDAPSATGGQQLKIGSYNGSSTVTWISGESTGNTEVATNWNPSLSTTGKAFVMGF